MVMKLNNIKKDELNIPRLIVIILLFCIGAVIGSYIGAGVNGQEDWWWEYINLSPQQFFRRDAVINLALAVVIFIGGFIPLGFLTSAAGIMIKGFISAVPITAFVRLYGVSGYFSAAKTGMISNFISVIALCLLSMQAIENSSMRRRKIKDKALETDKVYILCFCICSAALVFGAAIDGFLL